MIHGYQNRPLLTVHQLIIYKVCYSAKVPLDLGHYVLCGSINNFISCMIYFK